MPDTTVAIIGTGFSGLGMAIRLQQAGITDFALLESAETVGGTWRDNTYPGAACDVPSHLYSFSFELNPEWSRRFATQPEIRAYLEHCTHKYGLRDRIRFGARVREARWVETAGHWDLSTSDGGTLSARFLVNGVGALRDPLHPAIPGLADFAGPAMHSARWDHGVDLTGKRVGVVGTGASAIQIVPAICEQTAHVTLFQRTPAWVRERGDHAITDRRKALYRRFPAAMALERLRIYASYESRFVLFMGSDPNGRSFVRRLLTDEIKAQVGDAELAAALTPDYRPGCKRALLSDDFYPAVARSDVHLETTAIDRVLPGGVKLTDGREVDVDVLVYCTGFAVDRPLGEMRVIGRDGRDLGEFWGTRPRAYLGATVPGFPNSFALLGPNTALGHNSVVVMIEGGIRYALGGIRHALDHDTVLDVKPEALDAFVEEVDRKHRDLVWASGCDSWYRSRGENFTIWPGTTLSFLWRTRRFDAGAYQSGGIA